MVVESVVGGGGESQTLASSHRGNGQNCSVLICLWKVRINVQLRLEKSAGGEPFLVFCVSYFSFNYFLVDFQPDTYSGHSAASDSETSFYFDLLW